MRTLAVMASKGGVGKSTITVHLAVAAQKAGERVAILDTDPQHSALTWGRTREDREPVVVEVAPDEVPDALDEAKIDGYTLILIDNAPRAEPQAAATCRVSDFILVPVRPSAFDLDTVKQTIAIITAAGKASSSALLLNQCPARAAELPEARIVLGRFATPLAPVELGLRRSYSRAVESGSSVQETDPKGPASTEIAALWTYVNRILRSSNHRG
jgi:chromosome partitioning protein